jgi:hypothetical protein
MTFEGRIMNDKDAQTFTPDQAAAHQFLSELRARISTQPLPYQYGVEARALESLWEVFGQARSAMKNHPGCAEFARRTTEMLNVDLRPVTAKWHRAHSSGRLNSRDGANEFREDLEALQFKLRTFASELHEMAYGTQAVDEVTTPALTRKELDNCLTDLAFGIAKNALIPDGRVAAINANEADAVAKRRKAYGVHTAHGMNAVGLGLSGGGIRSATFCLGVTQVLAERNLLKDVDFLSTVSGGGYVGCFLTNRLGHSEPHSDVASPHGPDTVPVRYLRQHAKYLIAGNLKERWSMVTATFAGMILNWTAPLFAISLAALVAVGISSHAPVPWQAVILIASAVTLVSLIAYAFQMRFSRHSGGIFLGISTAITFFISFLWLLTRTYSFLIEHHFTINWQVTGIVAAGITAFPTIVRFIPILSKPVVRSLVLKTMLIAAGLIIPIGAIALSFWFYHLGTQSIDHTSPFSNPLRYVNGSALLAILTAIFGAVAMFLLNVNLTSPHRLYRDQLARTFIQSSESNSVPIPLYTINPDDSAPYHLINATANLPSSTSVVLRERKSDFFVFSKYWCGAPSIDYCETPKWQTDGTPLDLATALAVSGAAASPHMGLGSISSLTALLAFLNVRLGYWILRPERKHLFRTPGFLRLAQEMTGIAMSEEQVWINLSDGGHIENMGIYELLRRRCKFIISIDGESDPQSTFHGHLTLVRHAQIDFGIRIEPYLTELRPDITSKFSQAHTMLCRVHYPAVGDQPGGHGLLLYMKLSVTGNEAEIIKRYRSVHPEFPHQTTLDQFFDEEQFEVYRQLGVHVAEGMFSRALLHDETRPPTVAKWFAQLAASLLDPERA